MARTKTRADQFADLEERAPKGAQRFTKAPMHTDLFLDFDPEDNPDEFSNDDASDNSDDDTDAHAGRAHYAAVGKSKLRKKDVAPLGPQYTGSRISRQALDEDQDEHDPFEDYGSDEGSEDIGDDVNGVEEDEEEDDDEVEDMDSELDGEDAGTEDTSMSEDGGLDDMDEDDDLEDDEDATEDAQLDREQLKKMIHSERSNVAATIAQANKADADKGRAVKRQRQTFDSLLNSRIRLQQGLIAVNSIAAVEPESSTTTDAAAALEAAEKAALNLFNNLNSLRVSLATARGTKRAHSEISTSTPIYEISTQMTSLETPALAHRKSILSKWSTKTSAASAAPSRGKLNNTKPATLLDVLGSHLADPARLVARTHIPRSCAPVQANSGVTSSDSIYDDADFYGLLLKELLEQRSIDSASHVNVDVSAAALAKQHAQAARDAKTKKNVDTKASKGRKLRYTVHEPLQNFMASEERGTWTERMREELFAGLLGRKGGLEEMEEMDGEGGEEEALMLFRN